MRLTITIEDEVFEKYKRYAKGSEKPEQIMQSYIAKMADIDYHGRFLIISSAQRAALEAIIGSLVMTPDDLITKIKQLADLRIGDMQFILEPGELAEIKVATANYGLPLPEYFVTCLFNAGLISSPEVIRLANQEG